MQYKFAEWEIRNLGCRTLEVTLEKSDKLKYIAQDIENLRMQYDCQYVVVKADPILNEATRILQENEYKYIESQISLKMHREIAEKKYRFYSNIFDVASYEKITKTSDIEFVKNEILKGIFTTDRIALDQKFGVELANKRYANWLEDEMNKNSCLYIVKDNGSNVAFFLNKPINNRVQYALLGGVFKAYENKGFGALMNYCVLDDFINSERKIMETGVSSNNIVILQLHIAFGYKIKNIINVFIKHH